MSIAELFYPKNFRELVSDLKTSGHLNQQALDNINQEIINSIYKIGIIALVLIFLCSYQYGFQGMIYSSAIILSLLCLSVYLDAQRYIKIARLLGMGEETIATNVKFKKRTKAFNMQVGWDFYYSFMIDSFEQNSKMLYVFNRFAPEISLLKDNFSVLYDPKNPKDNILLLSEFEHLFNINLNRTKFRS